MEKYHHPQICFQLRKLVVIAMVTLSVEGILPRYSNIIIFCLLSVTHLDSSVLYSVYTWYTLHTLYVWYLEIGTSLINYIISYQYNCRQKDESMRTHVISDTLCQTVTTV